MKNVVSDPELWFLIVINGSLYYLYQNGQLDPFTIVWIYYVQSLLIGVQYFTRMILLRNQGGATAEATSPKRNALFFLLHYGAFHLIYFVFLVIMTATTDSLLHFDRAYFLTAAGGFIVNTVFSLISQIREDRAQQISVDSIFFIPYLRIVPMHLFIILGFGETFADEGSPSLTLNSFGIFLLLKTLSDILLYVITNKTWQRNRPRVLGRMI